MHQVLGRVAGEGKITIFFPIVLPPVVSSSASPYNGAGVPMKLTWWSGSSSWLAVVNGGVGSLACMDRAAVVARA